MTHYFDDETGARCTVQRMLTAVPPELSSWAKMSPTRPTDTQDECALQRAAAPIPPQRRRPRTCKAWIREYRPDLAEDVEGSQPS